MTDIDLHHPLVKDRPRVAAKAPAVAFKDEELRIAQGHDITDGSIGGSGFVALQGQFVNEFRNRLAKKGRRRIGVKYQNPRIAARVAVFAILLKRRLQYRYELATIRREGKSLQSATDKAARIAGWNLRRGAAVSDDARTKRRPALGNVGVRRTQLVFKFAQKIKVIDERSIIVRHEEPTVRCQDH